MRELKYLLLPLVAGAASFIGAFAIGWVLLANGVGMNVILTASAVLMSIAIAILADYVT